MLYSDFKQKLQGRVFGDDLNYEILRTTLQNPERYIGLFRVTNAKTKLIQNLTQSCEIKFGDFLEEIFTQYIAEMGYKNLSKKIGCDEDGNTLNADQVFSKDGIIYLIEQKVRDDHDSTKKRGQYLNFIKKIRALKKQYPQQKIVAGMWFVDDGQVKNKRFYEESIDANTDDLVTLHLWYGKEIFNRFFQRMDIWDEWITHLKQHKSERSQDILSVPDFDSSPEIRLALEKLKEREPRLLKKLFSELSKYQELRKELFPTGKNLKGLE